MAIRLIRALGDISEKNTLELIIPFLKDSEKYIRIEACVAAGKIDGEKALGKLINMLLTDSSDSVRRCAIDILSQFNGSLVIEGMIEALRDNDIVVKEKAGRILKSRTGQNFEPYYFLWKAWYEKNKDR